MDDIIESLIRNFYERSLPQPIERAKQLPQIAGKIDSVIGMRRSGKTYLLYQDIHEKLKKGIEKERLLYLNFDDERLLPMRLSELQLIPIIYYRLFPHQKQQTCFFYFDEIQNVPDWEKFVRRLIDTENIQLVLTGSSAKLLSKEIATSLRGRALATEVFPFSFKEALTFHALDKKISDYRGAETQAFLANYFRKYLLVGGFPEIQTLDEELRSRILQEYVDVVVLRDIVERYQIANVQALRAMERHLLANPATLFSVNKFYNTLQTLGITSAKNSLYEYMDYLADAYLIYPIEVFSRSERVKKVNPRKIYLIDTGLISAFLHQAVLNWGYLLENFVFMELRRHYSKINYYHTRLGYKVDFIVTTLKGEHHLYQVALHLEDADTREREIRALSMAMTECRIKTATLITMDQFETIQCEAGEIKVLPAWEWAIRL